MRPRNFSKIAWILKVVLLTTSLIAVMWAILKLKNSLAGPSKTSEHVSYSDQIA